MGIGLGVMGLAPAVFWGMTLKELAAAIGGRAGPPRLAAPTRAELAGLMQQFPD